MLRTITNMFSSLSRVAMGTLLGDASCFIIMCREQNWFSMLLPCGEVLGDRGTQLVAGSQNWQQMVLLLHCVTKLV